MQTIRYVVWWTPLADVAALAQKRGMRDGDGSSLWDWVDPEEYRGELTFATFDHAAAAAARVAPLDAFGSPRIERQLLVRDRDDRGHVFRSRCWETDSVWEFDPADPPRLAEDAPDIEYDLLAELA